MSAPSREAKRARRAVRHGRPTGASVVPGARIDGRPITMRCCGDGSRAVTAHVVRRFGVRCAGSVRRGVLRRNLSGESYRKVGTRCRLDGRWSKRHSRCVRNDRRNRTARAHRDVESWAQMLWIEMPQRPDARCRAVEAVTRSRTVDPQRH
ncbi:hypothetical protein Bmul_6094 [Burkholderia multivorans ATCC 17616]|nr:hypothetical protein Bmul_6094 [Burkholderia multivorans ATCC 17616]